MSELVVYFARAMDDISVENIIFAENEMSQLLEAIGAHIRNPFKENDIALVQDGYSVAEHDLERLRSSDVLLADLSLSGYQYIGCIFEIVHATIKGIPVVLIVGERDFERRVFFQAYCDFIARNAEEAIEYIRRAYTPSGLEQQMVEMKAYYDAVAKKYSTNSVRTHKRSTEEIEVFTNERAELREVIRKYASGDTCQIGIGTGDWTKTLCKSSNSVLGIEQSQEMLAQARVNLAPYENIEFIQMDVFKEGIRGGPFDCVVVYFLFSLLPSLIQSKLFHHVQQVLKPGGYLIIADTKKMGDLPAIGLGRRLLQKRSSGDREFTIYKEHFVGDSLVKLVEKHGYEIVDSNSEVIWFPWVVAYSKKLQ
jgi:ubiquinone/menaquinone biosynthesis C-methylase UbiE